MRIFWTVLGVVQVTFAIVLLLTLAGVVPAPEGNDWSVGRMAMTALCSAGFSVFSFISARAHQPGAHP